MWLLKDECDDRGTRLVMAQNARRSEWSTPNSCSDKCIALQSIIDKYAVILYIMVKQHWLEKKLETTISCKHDETADMP
jgi:hypothetical protein